MTGESQSPHFIRISRELHGNEDFLVGVNYDCKQILPEGGIAAPIQDVAFEVDEDGKTVDLSYATGFVTGGLYEVERSPLELILLDRRPRRELYSRADTRIVANKIDTKTSRRDYLSQHPKPPYQNLKGLHRGFAIIAQEVSEKYIGQPVYFSEVVELPQTIRPDTRILALKPSPEDPYSDPNNPMLALARDRVAKTNTTLGNTPDSLRRVAAPIVHIDDSVGDDKIEELLGAINKRHQPQIPYYIGELLIYAQKSGSV